MVTSLPQVKVGPAGGGRGFAASCSTCPWRIHRTMRVDADIEAVQHRAGHATPLHEDDDAQGTFRIDVVVA